MEDTTTGLAAEPEAPPGADAAVAEASATEFVPDHAAELKDDFSNVDDLIAQYRAAAEAEVADDEPAPEVVATTETPAPAPETTASKPAEETPPGEPDPAVVAEYLKQKGFEVKAPAPAPTPFEALTSQFAPLTGTPEQYAEAKAKALAPLPPLPDETLTDQSQYDAQRVAYTNAINERNQAASQLRQFDLARQAADIAVPWAEQRQMGQLGSALSELPAKYGLNPEQAKRVTTPIAMTDAVAAVAEAVEARKDAEWQAKLDARETYWKGQVARAGADKSAENLRRMGAAPQATSAPGAKVTDPFLALFSERGMPSDADIERAKRGELANIDLG